MLAPEEKPKLSTKPYLAATPQFRAGSSSPREFLERCLVDLTALEPKVIASGVTGPGYLNIRKGPWHPIRIDCQDVRAASAPRARDAWHVTARGCYWRI
jgi:hypothetical protein